MKGPLVFTDPEEFLAKLRELRDQGWTWRDLELHLPYHLHEVDAILGVPPGGVRFFAVAGGISGFLAGLALTIYTVLSWPLIVGGKPIVSLPPFLLIAYILVILLGSLGSFAGFLFLARLPRLPMTGMPEEFGNRFAIIPKEGGAAWKR